MSEFTEHRYDGTCQEKLAPPRSLRDEDRDAEMIWNVIVNRYPKAAPLLCEMEVAIERAENLLNKFRAAPYTNIREIGRLSSTHILNSDESNSMWTANSGTQLSMSDENDDVEEIGTRMSDDSILKNEDQANTSLSSSSSDDSVDHQEYVNSSSSRIPPITVDESRNREVIKNSTTERISHEDYQPINSSSQKPEWTIPVTSSGQGLNGLGKIVGEICEKSSTEKTTAKIRKIDASSTKNSTEIPEVKISPPSKLIDTTGENLSPAEKIPKIETTGGLKGRAKTAPTSSPVSNTTTNSTQGNVDENSWKNPSTKTPVMILNDYAKQCNEKLEFKVTRNKANSYEIECSFAGYNAKSVGHPESSVQNEVAVLILRILVGEQMDEKDIKNLVSFSNEQMKDVVALGTGGQPENAMRKLYKLCLEKNAPKPVYSVKTDFTPEGVKNIAECRALNKIATGIGIRDTVAKVSAAENLYTQLLSEESK